MNGSHKNTGTASQASRHFFYLSEPKILTPNRFYKVCVKNATLCGAWLGGQVFNEESRRIHALSANVAAPLFGWWLKRYVERRRIFEAAADCVDPLSADFLALHRHNFQIQSREINLAVIKKCTTLGSRAKIGIEASAILELHLKDSRRSFYLLESSQPRNVFDLLRPIIIDLRYELPEE